MDTSIEVAGALEWFYKTYGPNWTLLLVFSIPLAIFAMQVFLAIRKDREANLAIAAKEDTIQRLAVENKLYRIQFFKEKCGWTDTQIREWVLENDPPKSLADAKKKKK